MPGSYLIVDATRWDRRRISRTAAFLFILLKLTRHSSVALQRLQTVDGNITRLSLRAERMLVNMMHSRHRSLSSSLSTISSFPPSVSWHPYNLTMMEILSRKKDCDVYQNTTRARLYLGQDDRNITNYSADTNEYGLWPGLQSPGRVAGGETLFGFREATEIIWKSQNPENCSTAKYMIHGCHNAGFGSVVHVDGSLLSLAIKMGRVYLRHPNMCGYQWSVRNEFCKSQGKKNMDCYYEPYSKCTFEDALKNDAGQMLTLETLPIIHIKTERKDASGKKMSYEEEAVAAAEVIDSKSPFHHIGHRSVIMQHNGGRQGYSWIVPHQFQHILSCLPMNEEKKYYWWRALSATFLLRPNKATINYLEKYRTLPIKVENKNQINSVPDMSNGNCIAMYVRRADKNTEMQFVDFSKYAEAVEIIVKNGFLNHTKYENKNKNETINEAELGPTDSRRKPLIFIGTEEPSVLKEALAWGEKEGYQVVYTSLIDRETLQAKNGPTYYALDTHPLEYLSMLLNLEYAVKCDAFVGTLASNWCRLVDELRATVGGCV